MILSQLTPKCALIPSQFHDPSKVRENLASVVCLQEGDEVSSIEIPQYAAVLLYCSNQGENASTLVENDIPGETESLPEMFFILKSLPGCPDYNKILCTWADGNLFLAIAQGASLQLANVYPAADFTTAQYYILLAMKSLQLNPEVSTICWRKPISSEDEMSLYRYFKSVSVL